MTKPVVFVGMLGVLAGALALTLTHGTAQSADTTSPTSLADIAQRCAASTDVSGFGSVTIDKTIVSESETVTIAVPCTLHLRNGATLDIERASLKTDKLIVADDAAGPSSSLEIVRSAVIGAASAGLLVQLQHAGDSITVDHTSIDYPLSVFLTTQNADGSGSAGDISVTSTAISSTDPASEGIHLIAEGTGTFKSDSFKTPADDGSAVLYAASCVMSRVTGAVPKCSP